MATMIEKNIIILVGDLGSGVNHLKNIMLLSQQINWPTIMPVESRLEYLMQNIYPDEKIKNWMKFESCLRTWRKHYGVDIADNYADINTPRVREISQTQSIVFISHWPKIAKQLKIKYPGIRCIGLYPANRVDFSWQVKAYISKIGIENLQNFSFLDDIELNKQKHIDQHGIEDYYKTNVLNMFEIMQERAIEYRNIGECSVSIEDLISKNIDNVVSSISTFTGYAIDPASAQILHNRWLDIQPAQNCPWLEEAC